MDPVSTATFMASVKLVAITSRHVLSLKSALVTRVSVNAIHSFVNQVQVRSVRMIYALLAATLKVTVLPTKSVIPPP